MKIDGRFWINIDDKPFLGLGRIKLLQLIDETGSISKAAKELKMSYKAAWDMIDSMNSISDTQLVQSATGGSGGGGTVVTEKGKELIKNFQFIYQKHNDLFDFLSREADDLESLINSTKKIVLRTSARNQFWGVVVELNELDLTTELKIEIKQGFFLCTTITKKSALDMNITKGSEIYLLIKANFIELENKDYKNSFKTTITDIQMANNEYELKLENYNGIEFVTTLKRDLVDLNNYAIGQEVTVGINPHNIIVGI